ncbi:MAG: hypothetical protein QM647_00600 [Asticcacaulis sp.]|uniref:XAC2610-related protein n=1 Tax=Asticcacaulis sp. TaxID=1872648 RepID=UPI0039E24E92
MSPRPFLLSLIYPCLILCALVSTGVAAKTAGVEFPVWSRTYTGTLGRKTVEVQLDRIADRITGSYCYVPCTAETRQALQLRGALKGQTVQLTETQGDGDSAPKTGTWALNLEAANGTWSSPDGQRQLPLTLTRPADDFPFDIHVVASALPTADDCADTPAVSEIRLYRNGKLFQALPTDSQGTCDIFTPQIVDMNFDGHPDLMIAQTLPAAPNIPYDMWLYEPTSGRFVSAPTSLMDITSPEFDAAHHKVWNFWRGSCCDHGIDVYEWKNGELSQTDSGESYILPVRVGKTDYYCYIMPDYADGHVAYPDAIRSDPQGRLTTAADLTGCDIGPDMLERTRVDIWKETVNGWVLADTRAVTWQKTQMAGEARYCPVVPFLNNGRIQPALLTDPDLCSTEDPGPA